MITLKELNPHAYPTTPEQDTNLNILLERINKIRAEYGKPLTITSGLRSDADQARINPKAPKSQHLLGAACDIYDPDGDLKRWVLMNMPALEEHGLWCEEGTVGWQHFQIFPPKSGHRFFLP